MKRAGSDAAAGATAAAMAGLLLLSRRLRLDPSRLSLLPIESLGSILDRPFVLSIVLLLVLAGCVAVGLRVVWTDRALRSRVQLLVLAPDSFEPSMDAVLRFAAQLSRTRRATRGWFERRASAVRVLLDSDDNGRLRYSLSLPARAVPALRSALSAYDHVQLRPTQAGGRNVPAAGLSVLRCELRLARSSHEPLAQLPLDPDPLQGFASVIAESERRLGERVQVAIDLLPASAGERRRLRRRLLRKAHHASRPQRSLQEVLEGRRSSGRGSAGEMVQGRAQREEIGSKLAHAEPLFRAQILLRCQSRSQARAQGQMQGLLSCFDAFAAANHFRASGLRLLGLLFLGSDVPWRRGRFDERLRHGLFRPARESILTAREIAPLIKPPTVNCRSQSVLRLGPAVYPAPRTLPTFSGQHDLLPLGRVKTVKGERLVGAALSDTFFTYIAGRSRFGKTELAIGQFVHLVRSGHGGMFIDPHEDALARIKSFLTEPELAKRIVEIDVAGPRSHEGQPGWNLLAVKGLSAERRELRVEAVVDAFASALGWSERNNRALTITTHATAALAELATILPDELAPTIFQLPTLLSNDDWRAAILPHLSAVRRDFFVERLGRMSEEAITPVTNLIDRLRASTPLTALLGAGQASYDIARAMDQGRIVLACPGSGGARDRLVANLLLYDLLHGAKARAHVPPERRRVFHLFADEIQTYDGASNGTLAAMLEQTAKYGIRAILCNQNPERLTPATLNALTTNRSHLLTTALNSHAAGLIAREWGGEPNADAITHLPRHTFLTQLTHRGELTNPFLIQTLSATELHPNVGHEDRIAEIQPTIDTASSRRDARETIHQLDTLDQRIHAHITSTREPQRDMARPAPVLRDLPPRQVGSDA